MNRAFFPPVLVRKRSAVHIWGWSSRQAGFGAGELFQPVYTEEGRQVHQVLRQPGQYVRAIDYLKEMPQSLFMKKKKKKYACSMIFFNGFCLS